MRLMHIEIETEKAKKNEKLTNFFPVFFPMSKVLQFGMKFLLDSNTVLNSSSKLKANKLNTKINYQTL